MTTIIKLDEPITYGSETITQIELRKPKAKDMRGMKLNVDMDDMLTLASRCSNQPPSVIDELSFTDFAKVFEEVGKSIGGGLMTGKTV